MVKKRHQYLYLIGVLILLLILITGCGKAEEEIAEKILEQAVDENVELDVSGDNVSIKSEEGSFEAGQDLEWPSDSMGDLPAPKAEVTGILKANDNSSCTVTFTNMTLEAAQDYAKMMTQLGLKNGMNIADEDIIMITGKCDDDVELSFVYNIESTEGSIYFIKNVEE